MKKEDENLVNRYLDGELDQEEKAVFEKRLISDTELNACLREMRTLAASAEELPVFRAAEVSFSRVIPMAFSRMGYGLRPFLAGAASAVILLLIVFGSGVKETKPVMESAATEVLRIVYFAPGASSVSILGDFNGWADEIPLKSRGKGGYWLAELHLKPGEYRYVLMVDGQEEPVDPLADYVIDDDFGSKNSVIRIGL